ncbi:MAG: ABC transporter permease [Planctomycetales bacterium]
MGVWQHYRREVMVAGAWLAILAGVAFFAPAFFSRDQLRGMLVNAAPVLVVTIGTTLVMLTRQIDISIGSTFSVCGVMAGLAAQAGWPMPLVVGLALAIGTAVGGVNGFLIARLRLPAIVVTLSMLVALQEGLRYLRQGEFVRNLPPGFQWFGLSQGTGQALVIVLAVGVLLLAGWGLRSLAGGRAVYATGSDPEAARLVGIAPQRVTWTVFLVAGSLTGLAALLGAVRFSDVDPRAGAGLEMQAIAAVVVGGTSVNGGRGTLVGTLIGVLLLATIGPALVFLQVAPQWERALQGVVILAAVASDRLFRET